jgi:predicted nucleic-acid-binding protein
MIGLDTNVLVRYVLRDDVQQAEIVDKLIDKCIADHVLIMISLWVRLFSAKIFWLSRCHFEFIILRYRNIIALVLLTVVKDHVVLKITASAKGA